MHGGADKHADDRTQPGQQRGGGSHCCWFRAVAALRVRLSEVCDRVVRHLMAASAEQAVARRSGTSRAHRRHVQLR
eukprot:5167988-Prymnesium_polylepis.1